MAIFWNQHEAMYCSQRCVAEADENERMCVKITLEKFDELTDEPTYLDDVCSNCGKILDAEEQ